MAGDVPAQLSPDIALIERLISKSILDHFVSAPIRADTINQACGFARGRRPTAVVRARHNRFRRAELIIAEPPILAADDRLPE